MTNPASEPTLDPCARSGVALSPGTPNRAFQAVLDHIPGAWFFARGNGTLAYANKGACIALGYTVEELLSRTIFEIDPTLTPDLWSALWNDTLPMHSRTVRSRHRRKDGSDFPVEVRASRLYIDGEDLTASYTVDLTANERTEGLNRRLLAAIEQASESVLVTDASGLIEYVNPAYERSAGLRGDQVRGRLWLDLEVLDDMAFVASVSHALENARGFRGRVHSRRTNGERYHEDVSVSPIRDDAAQLTGWVVVKRDISEQLRLEQQLRQAQKVEAVGQLAGGIAHDFNNLLQVIHGQAHLIRMQADNAAIAPMLGEIDKAVDRASSLVRQLLAFSRKGTVEFSELRLDELIITLSGMLKRLLGEHVELEWTSEAGAVYVRGNAPQLEQVVANLCINARDAMPHGGRLELRLSRPVMEDLPRAARDLVGERAVVLTVSDDGVGMTPEVRERLFDPFFTTKAPGRGTGLGLATVHAVVQAHGGFIDVSSEVGRGATFRVVLPTVEGRATTPIEPQRRRRVEGRARWALVAEDEPAVRQITAGYLQRAGFRVLTARDGVEAEKILADAKVQVKVLVLDAVMPRRGGQAVHDSLREQGRTIPTVFVTGYDYESLAGAAQRPYVAIVQKPFSSDELLAQVANVLGESGAVELGLLGSSSE